jgi:hypothetical protein
VQDAGDPFSVDRDIAKDNNKRKLSLVCAKKKKKQKTNGQCDVSGADRWRRESGLYCLTSATEDRE